MKKVTPFLKKFIYESFRTRTINDYKDLNKESNETKFPWFYLRILLIGFLTFTIFTFISYITKTGCDEYLVFIGGSFITLSFLFISYEIDNNKEISISQMLAILVIGMTSVIVPNIIGTYVFKTSNKYLVAVRAGTVEEIGKAIYAIITVFVMQKINKKQFKLSTVLIIGFAIGAGFAIAEDFYYLTKPGKNLFDVSQLSLRRGINGFHAHMIWTGLITYAFFRFKKPLINYRFYLVLIGAMVVHTYWDIFTVPFINDDLYYWIREANLFIHLLLSIIISLIILIRNNNKKCNDDFNEKFNEELIELEGVDTNNTINKKLNRKETSKLIVVLFVVLFLLFTYQYIYLDSTNKLFEDYNTYTYYDTFEHFKYVAQGNREFNIDRNREYDNTLVDSYAEYINGELNSAIQCVKDGEVTYRYHYSYDEEAQSMKLIEVTIDLESGYVYEDYLLSMDPNDETIYIYYDVIGLTGLTWSEIISATGLDEDRTYLDLVIDSNELVYIVNDHTRPLPKFYALVIASSIVLISGAVCLIIYNVKSKRKEEKEE